MAKTNNKILEQVNQIDAAIALDCGDLSTNDDSDRAHLAWWIFKTFCQGDYRVYLRNKEIESAKRGMIDRAGSGGDGSDAAHHAAGGSGPLPGPEVINHGKRNGKNG